MLERHGGSLVVNNNRTRRDKRLAWASEVHPSFWKIEACSVTGTLKRKSNLRARGSRTSSVAHIACVVPARREGHFSA
jgi:hypothetical protein